MVSVNIWRWDVRPVIVLAGKSCRATVALLLVSTTLAFTVTTACAKGEDRGKPTEAEPATNLKINLDQAVDVKLPEVRDLKPVRFETHDGKGGWALRIPGNRPIATPAYADGMLFVGGGYGSHEFYAFKAKTGEVVWKISTGDDGPTAAVVEDGYVAFNTESCTVIVVDEKTGKIIWQEWLGDPLMSQPAISNSRLFIVYPSGQRNPKHSPSANLAKLKEPGYRLLAVDLKTGLHLWEQEIPTDVISAPVLKADSVYITCFDGTSFAFDAVTGHVLWTKKGTATSAPLPVEDKVVFSRKQVEGSSQYEGLARVGAVNGDEKDQKLLAKGKADYLAKGEGRASGITVQAQKSLDSSVGFSSAPAAAKMSAASENVGVNSIVGGWAYQGSRAAHNAGLLLNAQGKYLNSVSTKDGRPLWKAEVVGKTIDAGGQVFSPPSLGVEYMYLSGSSGNLVSVRQKDGRLGFAYSFKRPMIFQPALVDGNVYVGTGDGLLICLQTNNKDADGWYEWGGNAQHNK